MRISDWSSDVCSSDLLGLSDPELDLLLAYSQLGQQEFDAVVSGIDEELKADSALERDLFVARGEALLGLGRFDEAEAIFDRVLQDGPHVQALVNKARIALALSDRQASRDLLYRAAAIDPQDPRLLERSEEHTSELQSLMRHSYDVFCL